MRVNRAAIADTLPCPPGYEIRTGCTDMLYTVRIWRTNAAERDWLAELSAESAKGLAAKLAKWFEERKHK